MSEVEKLESMSQSDLIVCIYIGNCESLSGRSTLTYEVGRREGDSTLHLRIAGNTGGGMWCKDWVAFQEVESIVMGVKELKAQSFHCLHPGKSINTGGFVLAAVRDLGLIRRSDLNTRLHEHVPMATLELLLPNLLKAREGGHPIRQASKSHRKAKEGA